MNNLIHLIRDGTLEDIKQVYIYKVEPGSNIDPEDDLMIVRASELEFWRNNLINLSAEYGRLDTLKWLKSIGVCIPNIALSKAALSGNMEMIEWLHEEVNIQYDIDVFLNASSAGHLELLKWLKDNGCPVHDRACEMAAVAGHLEVLKWLVENNFNASINVCSLAASGGHYDIIKWARQVNIPWNSDTTANIAKRGDLDMLKWVRDPIEQGGIERICRFDEGACQSAAGSGHIEVLKWLIENGCPCNYMTMLTAVSNGNLNVVKLLTEEFNMPLDIVSLCFNSLAYDNMDLMEYLHDKCRNFNWKCEESRCRVCIAKRNILSKAGDDYTDWLSLHLINSLT